METHVEVNAGGSDPATMSTTNEADTAGSHLATLSREELESHVKSELESDESSSSSSSGSDSEEDENKKAADDLASRSLQTYLNGDPILDSLQVSFSKDIKGPFR